MVRGGGKKPAWEAGLKSLKSITHPTMMILGIVITYLKKIQKIYESRDTALSILLTSVYFHRKSSSFFISRNTAID